MHDTTAERRECGLAPTTGPRRGGFTVIEVLVVVGIIILLLSILIVATNKAVRTAQSAKTQNLMVSMKQGLIRFQEDIGYFPPVLGGSSPLNARDLWQPPDIPDSGLGAYVFQRQSWYSITSLADYLIGYGSESQDGYGDLNKPVPGIRSPGRDGVWGATFIGNPDLGPLVDRNKNGPPGLAITGQVFGPYIELKDDDLLGSLDSSGNVHFPGDANYDETDPKVIADYWGMPIRYYRKPYPRRGLKQSFGREVLDSDGDGTPDTYPSLSDVFLLRPYNFDPSEQFDSPITDFNPIVPDSSSWRPLLTGSFALFSSGADKSANLIIRADADELNKDNIVEVGP